MLRLRLTFERQQNRIDRHAFGQRAHGVIEESGTP